MSSAQTYAIRPRAIRLLSGLLFTTLLAACQVGEEAPEEGILEGIGIPPPVPRCGQPVFWLGEHSAIFTPWYDASGGQAGAAWQGSAVPAGRIWMRGSTSNALVPCISDPTGWCGVYQETGWYDVVAGNGSSAAPGGFEWAEFYFEIWGQALHCYVDGWGGLA